MNRRDLLTALAITALLPKGSNAESPHVQSLKRNNLANLDLREAPLPLALELLLGAYGLKTPIGSTDKGLVSIRTTDQPLETNLDLIKRSADNRFELQIENSIYKIIALPEKETPASWQLMAVGSHPEGEKQLPATPRTVLDIPRRVCGILSTDVEGRGKYFCRAAILETGKPDNSLHARIVRVGDRVASGLPGTPDLRVASLSPKGVTLETQEGDLRFLVRLANTGAPYPWTRPVPQQNPAKTDARPMEPILLQRPLYKRTLNARPVSGMKLAPKAKRVEGGKNP